MVNMVTGYKIYGAYQPDTIKSFKGKDGKDYLITANEGDAKVRLTPCALQAGMPVVVAHLEKQCTRLQERV